MSPRKFPDGSQVLNARTEAACLRAIDSCMTVIRSADRLSNELVHTAPSSGIIRLPVDEDDSLVVAVKEAQEASRKV